MPNQQGEPLRVRSLHLREALSLVGMLFLLPFAHVHGQSVSGVVKSGGEVVPAVTVELLGGEKEVALAKAITDSSGAFTLRAPEKGIVRIRTTRIGLEPFVSMPLNLVDREQVRVEIEMRSIVTQLPAIEIVERRLLTARELMGAGGFEYRRGILSGVFIDTTDILELKGAGAGEMIRARVSGVYLKPGRGYGESETLLLRVLGEECPPWIFLDGKRLEISPTDQINRLRPEEIFGIEIYRGQFNIPAEFPGVFRNRPEDKCGLIAVWTRWHVRK